MRFRLKISNEKWIPSSNQIFYSMRFISRINNKYGALLAEKSLLVLTTYANKILLSNVPNDLIHWFLEKENSVQ